MPKQNGYYLEGTGRLVFTYQGHLSRQSRTSSHLLFWQHSVTSSAGATRAAHGCLTGMVHAVQMHLQLVFTVARAMPQLPARPCWDAHRPSRYCGGPQGSRLEAISGACSCPSKLQLCFIHLHNQLGLSQSCTLLSARQISCGQLQAWTSPRLGPLQCSCLKIVVLQMQVTFCTDGSVSLQLATLYCTPFETVYNTCQIHIKPFLGPGPI